MECSLGEICVENVVAFCIDCNPKINLCVDHTKQHVVIDFHLPRRYDKDVLKKINFSLIKAKIREFQMLAINETLSIIKKLNKNLKKTLKQMQGLSRNIDSLKDLNWIFIDQQISKDIQRGINNLFYFDKKRAMENLYDFKDNSNELFSFNCPTRQYSKIVFPSLSFQSYLPVLCPLNNKFIFLHGGYNEYDGYSGFTFILDLESSTYKTFCPGVVRSCASGELVGSRVYVFGGYRRSYLDMCNYFDLETLQWVAIQKFSVSISNSSILHLNGFILISAYKNQLSRYYIEANCYESLNNAINI